MGRGDTDGWQLDPGDRAALVERCRRLLVRVPRATVTHATALALHDVPVEPPLGGGAPAVHLTVPRGCNAPVRRGVVGHRGTVPDVVTVDGCRTSAPAVAWCETATGGSLEQLVVAGDALWAVGLADPSDLRHELSARRGRRGAVLARRALRLLDRRSAGVDESRLRVVLARGGLRPPAVAHDVRAGDGTALATLPLAWPVARVGVRIARPDAPDGDPTRSAWYSRVVRDGWLQDEGWTVVDVPVTDLRRTERVVGMVRCRLRSRAPFVAAWSA